MEFTNQNILEFGILGRRFQISVPSCFKILIWYTWSCPKYGEYRQAVKTSDCGSDMRGFESHYSPH